MWEGPCWAGFLRAAVELCPHLSKLLRSCAQHEPKAVSNWAPWSQCESPRQPPFGPLSDHSRDIQTGSAASETARGPWMAIWGWMGSFSDKMNREGKLQRLASHSFSAAPWEVRVQGCDVVVICSILRGAGAGQLELLGSVGELECGVWVGCVRQQGALPLQHVSHSFEQVQETKG